MITTCKKCGLRYDDARKLTGCPHEPIMSDEDLAQKDAGIALALIRGPVRFRHQIDTGPDFHVQAVGWNGMVTLSELPGEFAPYLFAAKPRSG